MTCFSCLSIQLAEKYQHVFGKNSSFFVNGQFESNFLNQFYFENDWWILLYHFFFEISIGIISMFCDCLLIACYDEKYVAFSNKFYSPCANRGIFRFFFIQQYENELFQQLSHFMVFAYVLFFYLYKLSCKSNYIVPGIALYDMRKYMKIAGYYIYYFINEDTKDSHVEKCTKYRMECLCL